VDVASTRVSFSAWRHYTVKYWLGLIVFCTCLVGCNRNQITINNGITGSLDSPADILITEEPNFAQDIMNEQMRVFIAYLEEATGLTVDYVPAINYAHSHELLVSGKVDLLWAGSLGTSKVLSADKKARPIATELESFINVLLVDRKILGQVEVALGSERPLRALKGRRVVFGSNFSGSTFLTPLIEMKSQGVYLNDLKSCMHEPKHGHRAMFIGDSDQQDFAFVPGSKANPLKHVPEQARPEIVIAWVSDIKRNYYITASPEFLKPSSLDDVRKVQNALIALNEPSESHDEVLQALGVTGFELPQNNASSDSMNELTEFVAALGDDTRCNNNK
jgi:ABC-type phosphate/phosphonate transport system substrate-binding protein